MCMFCNHDKHELYDFIKKRESATVITSRGDGKENIAKKWNFLNTESDYIALALNLVFDNLHDAEERKKELVAAGKLIEKNIIKGVKKVE